MVLASVVLTCAVVLRIDSVLLVVLESLRGRPSANDATIRWVLFLFLARRVLVFK